ncbi:restriction endonuclease subunit S [Haliangium sp.]|uniref:restriction endonuclease subunit S n=1 Tax=Haliangium sp. TaxID=2663208 RepID=UPI003D126F56
MSERRRRGNGSRAQVEPGAVDLAEIDLPSEWTLAPLGSLAVGEGRYGATAPAACYDPSQPRYVRITDIDDYGRLRPESRASIDAARAEPHRLARGDLLFARTGGTVGKTYLYREHDGDCAHAGYLIRFTLDQARCEPAFVAYYTQSDSYWRWLQGRVREAAQPNINAAELASLPVPLPPLPRQRAIADIMDRYDRVISLSERIEHRLTCALRGLVTELLSRGIGPDGLVRDPGRDPAGFRDTALGPLPRGFEVAPLGELLAAVTPAMRSGPFGTELQKSDLSDEGVPLLGIDNVEVDRFVPSYRRFVPPALADELSRYRVRPGDVMVTIMGTVGRACLAPRDLGPALSSKHIWVLSIDTHRYLPLLVAMQLNFAPWVAAHFRREAQGGTMDAIRSETLRTTLVPVPPRAEQERIACALRLARRRLRCERATLDKRRHLRRALLEDLMSGRAQVEQS